MKHSELVEAIKIACEYTNDPEMWVYGSQAILGNFPQAELIEDLSVSVEVDMTPKNQLENIGSLDGLFGEGSNFHHFKGYYIHGVPIHEAAVLPEGWQSRCVLIKVFGGSLNLKTGLCIEVNDLVASKLVRFEDKDREFARAALQFGLAEADRIISRISTLNITEEHADKLCHWIDRTKRDLPKRSSSDKVGLPYGEVHEQETSITEYPKEPLDVISKDACSCGALLNIRKNSTTGRIAMKLCRTCYASLSKS